MSARRVVVVGGGAAGFFAAITAAEADPTAEVLLLEKGPRVLTKVLISGGGRCNVTHACFAPQELSLRYPRGAQALIGPFHRFQPRDTMAWFEARGVRLKTERDGRVFPASDSSQTIADCLERAARDAGVQWRTGCGLERATPLPAGGFDLELLLGEGLTCDRLLLATGGCRAASAGAVAVSLGHRLEPPVPSLFAFEVAAPWLTSLAGVSLDDVEAWVPGTALRERGALLVTHRGLSGPAILRLSAWGARVLHGLSYRFPLLVNWLPGSDAELIGRQLDARRRTQAARLVVNAPMAPLTARLWAQLTTLAGISRETRWAALSRADQHRLAQILTRSEFRVSGKSLNKEEFVTCGGVPLDEVNFKTMESRRRPRLFFAGELLDLDGITGGFNFQAAWTTGWIAGRAMVADAAPGLKG